MIVVPLRRLGLALLLLLTVLAVGPARGQEAASSDAAAALNKSEIERLLTTLENPEARERFIRDLRGLIDARRTVEPEAPLAQERLASRFLEALSEKVAEIGEALLRAAAFVADAPKLYAWLYGELADTRNRQRLLEIFATVIGVLIAGWLAEYIANRLLLGARRWIEARPLRAGWARLPFAVLDALVSAIPVIVFAAVAFGALTLSEPSRVARLVALAFINANLIARAVMLVVGILLSPRVTALRPLPLADETAAYLHIWARRLTNIAIYGYFIAEAALLLGIPPAGHGFLQRSIGVIIGVLAVILILQNRQPVAQAIAAPKPRPNGADELQPEAPRPDALRSEPLHSTRQLAAAYWHVAAILYVAIVFLVWIFHPDGGPFFVIRATLITMLALVAMRVAVRLAQGGVRRLFRVTDEIRQRFPALEVRANRYLQIFNLGIAVAAYGFAAIVILQAWGLRSLDWLTSPTGQRVVTSAISITLILVIAVSLWESINAVLDRYARRVFGAQPTRRGLRVRTLITLTQNGLLAVLCIFVGMIVLSEIGINIAPLIAGAGVVGLAVGLGAQTLVKNLIEGIANLIEDSFAVGDVVKLGDLSGVVEEISMRTVRLRDFAGHVHTIPFSEIKTITNMTRDFSFAVFDLGVSYDADVAKVREVMLKEAAGLRADPELGAFITGDLEIAGLDNFGDSAITIKARLRTLPGKQWPVQRAFNQRIKAAFDREGIEIPFPQRTIRIIGDGKPAAAGASDN